MADVIIRQAGPADAKDIYEIEKICFPDPWSMDSIKFELEENPDPEYWMREYAENTYEAYVREGLVQPAPMQSQTM